MQFKSYLSDTGIS